MRNDNTINYRVKSGFREWCAVGMLLAGTVLTYINYFTPPRGELSESVLYYFAQCLLFAGSMLGISTYVNTKVRKALDLLMEEQRSVKRGSEER